MVLVETQFSLHTHAKEVIRAFSYSKHAILFLIPVTFGNLECIISVVYIRSNEKSATPVDRP